MSFSSDANNITINSTDTYTETEITQKNSDLINGEPETMNTLNEIASVVGQQIIN